MSSKMVVIDADFTNLICECDKNDLFIRIFKALELQPVMAWYVADEEMLSCRNFKALRKDGHIKVIYPQDFLQDEISRKLFTNNIRSVAKQVNGEQISDKLDVLAPGFHVSGKNLGEIISELMAKELEVPMFASNDWGAKRYAQSYINTDEYKLEVSDIVEVLEILVAEKKYSALKRKEVKKLLEDPRWQNRRDNLLAAWDCAIQ